MPSPPAWAEIPQPDSGKTEPSPAFKGLKGLETPPKSPLAVDQSPEGPLQMSRFFSPRPRAGSLSHERDLISSCAMG